MGNYILEMRGICKSFSGVPALDHAQLSLRPGTVHALMGENGAGKSTLMKCMFGIYKMDDGQIVFNGNPITVKNPAEAHRLGIAMVHQELQPVLTTTVAENIFLGRFPVKNVLGFLPLVDRDAMNRAADKCLEQVQLQIDPKTQMHRLSVSQMQSVEIAKAISNDCRVLILDEPTSSLTEHETNALFRIIHRLKEHGVAVVYISHKMEEILKISDDVTIMRDGKYIGTWSASELNKDTIIAHMVGRPLSKLYPAKKSVRGKELLRVTDLTSQQRGGFRDVSFVLHEGEILGIGGLVGAQRTELMEAVFGIRPHSAGKIFLHGQEVSIRKPADAIHCGLAMLTEDRRESGLFGVLSVSDNIVISALNRCKGKLLLSKTKQAALTKESIEQLKIKVSHPAAPILSLSGGNQQKALIGRWLTTRPQILILDEPTRGIDVGAKYEIYRVMQELANQGMGILMISSEMEELLGMSDRVLVMCAGRMTGILNRNEATQKAVMELATRYSE